MHYRSIDDLITEYDELTASSMLALIAQMLAAAPTSTC